VTPGNYTGRNSNYYSHVLYKSLNTPNALVYIGVEPFHYPLLGQDFNDATLDHYRRVDVSFNFITCKADEYILLVIFAKPFEVTLWIALIAVLILVTVILKIVFLKLGIPDESVTCTYKTMLEQNVQASTQLSKDNSIKYMLSSLLFGCLVLINSYRGMMTSDLSAPPAKTQLKTIQEVVAQNFSIIITIHGANQKSRNNSYDHKTDDAKFYNSMDSLNSFVSLVIQGRERQFKNLTKIDYHKNFQKVYHGIPNQRDLHV
jgi:hypothetical protein